MSGARLIQMSGIVVDTVYRVEAVPAAGQEAVVRGARLCVGGGFNAMLAARRAGLAVRFAGTLGTGPLADTVAAALAAEGIEHIGARLADRDQGSCTVLVDDAGERTFIGLPGADGVVSDADLARVVPGAADWVLQSGYALSYPGSGAALARWLAALPEGTRLVFDPGPRVGAIAAPALRAALGAALWISANAAEAAVLSGRSDPAEAAAQLAADRPAAGGAVVRCGAEGAWIATPRQRPGQIGGQIGGQTPGQTEGPTKDQIQGQTGGQTGGQGARHLPGHAVRAIDTNGAGDAHTGYFIALLAEGHAPEAALAAANIAAALSTTLEGPATAPTRARVEALLPRPTEPLLQQGSTR